MALILIIETATTVCSVALSKDGNTIALKEINNGYTHAENLTVFIDELIKANSYSYKDLDAVAISKGPGSYTGLRIGTSTAKGLCYGLTIPLIAINTLEGMAFTMNKDSDKNTLLCPMLDARRMEVYCAVYNHEMKEIMPTNAMIIDTNSFADLLDKHQIIFFGDGADKCKRIITPNNAIFKDNIYPSASNLSNRAETLYRTESFESVAYFEPYYLKDFLFKKSENNL